MFSRSSRTLCVGNLPGNIRENEVEDLFYKYGPIAKIDLRIRPRLRGYAFIEFEEPCDAEHAIRGRDGYEFAGHRLQVKLTQCAYCGRASSSSSPVSVDRYSTSYSSHGGGVSRRSEYRVLITGLPSSASRQDLKNHMGRAGEVCLAQVFREGDGMRGIVDYTSYDDMKYAIRELDNSRFQNRFSTTYIRVKDYDPRPSHSRSRSRSPSPRSRSPSSSPSPRRRSPSSSCSSSSRSTGSGSYYSDSSRSRSSGSSYSDRSRSRSRSSYSE